MTMGTATANSILVVSYARERLQEHGDALRAAIEAGTTRFRPVLMTASAMIIGMVPMATGYSPNAPLGRAVIGGLLVATICSPCSSCPACTPSSIPGERLAKRSMHDGYDPAWKARDCLRRSCCACSTSAIGFMRPKATPRCCASRRSKTPSPPWPSSLQSRWHRPRPLRFPAILQAWFQAPIYAQVSGYVKMWYKDYGALVKKGDVLAEINAPALDAQYAQAKADLAVGARQICSRRRDREALGGAAQKPCGLRAVDLGAGSQRESRIGEGQGLGTECQELRGVHSV